MVHACILRVARVRFPPPSARAPCSPFAAPADAAGSVMVRRVAATEGEELECDDPQEAPLRIPQVAGEYVGSFLSFLGVLSAAGAAPINAGVLRMHLTLPL